MRAELVFWLNCSILLLLNYWSSCGLHLAPYSLSGLIKVHRSLKWFETTLFTPFFSAKIWIVAAELNVSACILCEVGAQVEKNHHSVFFFVFFLPRNWFENLLFTPWHGHFRQDCCGQDFSFRKRFKKCLLDSVWDLGASRDLDYAGRAFFFWVVILH